MAEEKKVGIEELKQALAAALASNEVEAITKASAAIVDYQRGIAKAAAESARAEVEKLSGARTELAVKLNEAIKKSPLGKANFSISLESIVLGANLVLLIPDIVKQVEAVKGTVVKFMLPDDASNTARVALAVLPTKRVGGGGGGGGGTSKAEYGLALGEIFDKFATDADKANLASATSNIAS